MPIEFEAIIAVCRQSYAAFQQLAGRTDDALYEALGQIHALRYQMCTDTATRAKFDELLQLHTGGKAINETLFLVKYAFFPHTLQPGPGHKADITKASRYAKLTNKALDGNVAPADFVAFARQQGIQRTAVGSRWTKRPLGRGGPPRRVQAPSRNASVPAVPSFLAPVLVSIETSFHTSEVATRVAAVLREAKDQPHRILLTIYVNDARAVLTGVTGKPWHGAFPNGTIREISAAPAPPPPTAVHPPVRKDVAGQLPRPGTRPPLRGTVRASTHNANRGRQRGADGYVWPTWRAFR